MPTAAKCDRETRAAGRTPLEHGNEAQLDSIVVGVRRLSGHRLEEYLTNVEDRFADGRESGGVDCAIEWTDLQPTARTTKQWYMRPPLGIQDAVSLGAR